MPKKPTLPHPGNVQNRKVAAESEAFIHKGKAEEALWSATVKSANALQTKTCEDLAKKMASLSQQKQEAVAAQRQEGEASDASISALLRLQLRGSIDANTMDVGGAGLDGSTDERDAVSLARDVLERVQREGRVPSDDSQDVEYQVRLVSAFLIWRLLPKYLACSSFASLAVPPLCPA